jgi:hypothetical protein
MFVIQRPWLVWKNFRAWQGVSDRAKPARTDPASEIARYVQPYGCSDSSGSARQDQAPRSWERSSYVNNLLVVAAVSAAGSAPAGPQLPRQSADTQGDSQGDHGRLNRGHNQRWGPPLVALATPTMSSVNPAARRPG